VSAPVPAAHARSGAAQDVREHFDADAHRILVRIERAIAAQRSIIAHCALVDT